MGDQPLRSGFTTGTCAAVAAKAAAILLFTGRIPEQVSIETPRGQTAVFDPEWAPEPEYDGYLRVQKDAGDDPDVTHGSFVYASVRPAPEIRWSALCADGRGYEDGRYPGLYINGGAGIGVVTRRGLNCPVGRYAINPVPRQMIWEAVDGVRHESGRGCDRLEILVAIPEGAALAKKTFNPRLGIEGGLSVLGTTGIVEPMSEQALVETIRLDIRMKADPPELPVIVTPGNYGEAFLQERLGVPLGEAVKCSNFIGDAVTMMVEEGAKKLLLVGHIGKLVKVAGGVKNTHSKYGDRRMELMAELAQSCAPELVFRILEANTTEEAVGILERDHKGEEALCLAALRVQKQIDGWTAGRLKTEVVTFSSAYGILGVTGGTQAMLAEWKAGRAKASEIR